MAKKNNSIENRKDILLETDKSCSRLICDVIENSEIDSNDDQDDSRTRIRKSLIEQPDSDPNGFERVIGNSDFVSVNFLERGIEAAKAVCRIRVPGQSGGWSGTGFLAGPGILVTNNHVLSTPKEASQAEAEFGYQHDFEGVLQPPIQFNLAPEEFFFTNIEHDITLVGINDYSDGGVPLYRFGWLPLIPLSGKGLDKEWVTIPQHPGGQPKQMSVRANQIIDLRKHNIDTIDTSKFIHYTTDTQPGSSGSPVLNDQWQVVAVHHKAIPSPDSDIDAYLAGEKEIDWIANEGIRISAITSLLGSLRYSDSEAAKALDKLERGIGIPSRLPVLTFDSLPADNTLEKDPNPHRPSKWKKWTDDFKLGYDPGFLSHQISIDNVLGDMREKAASLKKGNAICLDYLHFSTVIHKERKFPIIAAVNIDGNKLIHPGNRSARFRKDPRIDDEFQPAANFYERKLGNDPVQFSRGHLVRRLDPCWGDDQIVSEIADVHTFHYTNAAPQIQRFNAGDWLDIEDYILNKSQIKKAKVTIFTGPVFRENDPFYGFEREGGPWQIPMTYWKVAVIEKENGEVAATAFLQGQLKFVQSLFETKVFRNLRNKSVDELQSENLQTTIRTVEEETGLDFGLLKSKDISSALESTRKTRLLKSIEDIII